MVADTSLANANLSSATYVMSLGIRNANVIVVIVRKTIDQYDDKFKEEDQLDRSRQV